MSEPASGPSLRRLRARLDTIKVSKRVETPAPGAARGMKRSSICIPPVGGEVDEPEPKGLAGTDGLIVRSLPPTRKDDVECSADTQLNL